MPYVDSNLGDYVQNEIPLATLQEMVTSGTVPPNQVFLTPESEDVGMTNVYVNNELQKTLSFDSDPQTQITENKTNINKKLEPSNIKAGANINITTSGNDVTINAVAEAGGTIVNVNGVKQDIIDFTSDPQTQINSKFNSTNVVQSTGTSTTQVMSQKATTDSLNGKIDWSAIKQSTGTGENVVMSQKATTDELNAIITALSNKFTNHSQSAYDCNTCYDEGVYLIANGSNCPSGSQYGSLFVMPYRKPTGNTKPDYCTQIYLPNGDDSTDPNSMFYRTSLADSWNPWQKVATTDELDSKLPMFSSSAYDMNTCTESGTYPISNGTNGPSEKSIGDLFVMKRGDGVCSQLFINLTAKLGSTVYPSKMFYRGKYADGWCPWKEVADYNTLYPVGAIYISTFYKSPASFIGGEWEQILGKFLLSSDDVLNGDGEFTTTGSYHVGYSGGEATHKLEINEMPIHGHKTWSSNSGYSANTIGPIQGSSKGIGTTEHNSTYTNDYWQHGTTGRWVIGLEGGSQPHNNMPPYYTVYMWRRTA